MAADLSGPENPPFSRIFNRDGDIEYTGCGNTEHRGLHAGQSTALIAILLRLAWGKVQESMFRTVIEA